MIDSSFDPCPFCGKLPDVSADGTWIEIQCCVSMNRQKCDYLTIEERKTNGKTDCSYGPKAEDKVLGIVRNEWNSRVIK